MKRYSYFICLLLGMLISVQGCVALPKIVSDTRYYPQCVEPFVALQEAHDALIKKTALSAAIGGAAGGVVGGVLTGSWQGALIGIGIGAVAGAITGFSYQKYHQIKDHQQRMLAYRGTATCDLSTCNELQLAAYESLQCYIREFSTLLSSYAQRNISQADFMDRYAEIQRGMKEVYELLSESGMEMSRLNEEFREVLRTDPQNSMRTLPAPKANVKAQNAKYETELNSDPAFLMSQLLREIEQYRNAVLAQQDVLADKRIALAETRQEMRAKRQQVTVVSSSRTKTSRAKTISRVARPDTLQSVISEHAEGYGQAAGQLKNMMEMNERIIRIMAKAASQAGLDVVFLNHTKLAMNSGVEPKNEVAA